MANTLPKKKHWWKVAKEEGRICRLCKEPVAKATWNDKRMDHLCQWCWQREDRIQARIGNRFNTLGRS